jgi:hypothetical protein
MGCRAKARAVRYAGCARVKIALLLFFKGLGINWRKEWH